MSSKNKNSINDIFYLVITSLLGSLIITTCIYLLSLGDGFQDSSPTLLSNNHKTSDISLIDKENIKIVDDKQVDNGKDDTQIEQLSSDNSSEWMTFQATAYTAFCNTGCIGVTATGLDVSNTIYTPKGRRVIAVDPSIISLGSLVKVRYGDKEFIAKASDTGGNINNYRIDILMKTKEKALQFGRRNVQIKIIKEN